MSLQEKQQSEANWVVHTILYDVDQEFVEEALWTVNRLPREAVLKEVLYYDPAAIRYFEAWLDAGGDISKCVESPATHAPLTLKTNSKKAQNCIT